MADFTFSHDCIILDACCVINLYASEKMEQILNAIPKSVHIAAYVKNAEVLKVYDNRTKRTQEIDLEPLIDQGILNLVELDLETEADTRVALTEILDDGEAITRAIALHRNWAIATDDKVAIRVFRQRAEHLQIITTPKLIKYWADKTIASPDVIQACLRNIMMKASYHPAKRHHLYHWWQSFSS